MTVNEAIALVDKLKPNRFSAEEKRLWLSNLDGQIMRELVETHEGNPLSEPFEFYDARSGNAELIAPFPYDEMYRWYLESQIDLANAEIAKYNNSRAMFNNAYMAYTDYYNRKYMPKSAGRMRFTAR